jgi:DNA-binding PadR family transcriptional regulator
MFRFIFDTERNPHARMFKKGDIKYVILDLLKDKPSHGYEIIRALEDRFHGFYSPSAGSVYPTLQLLEDMGYVTSATADGKKIYSITEEGKKFLAEREETMDRIREQVSEWWGPGAGPGAHGHGEARHGRDWWGPHLGQEFDQTFKEWGEIARLMGRKVRHMNQDKLSRIKKIMAQTRRDIEEVLSEEE